MKTKWKPKEDDKYWYFNMELYPEVTQYYPPTEDIMVKIGNCFHTKKQCCAAIRKIKKILKES